MARELGESVTDWSTINERRLVFLDRLLTGSDLLVFAYGSLLWNPMLRFDAKYPATLKGYQRRFCLNIIFFRGSPENPGLMMALDSGGQCQGICYRIPAEIVEEETRLLWMRECCLSGYCPEWVMPDLSGEQDNLPTMTFVANQNSKRYLNNLSASQIAKRIMTGRGDFGSNQTYFDNTLKHLRALNIHDPELESLQAIMDT